MPDTRSKRAEIPFSGKLMTSDPATVGQNFQTLKNMRYTDTHVKGIAGFAKVTTAVIDAANKLVKSAWHFLKSQPFESHILVQSYNTALSGAGIYDCITTPPTSAAFSSTSPFTQSSGFGLGRFSDAPDGQMIFCNSVDSCIWGGVESKIGSLVSVTAAMTAALSSPTGPKDFTKEITNTKTDALNVFTCGGSYLTFLIGTTRPTRAGYFYVSSANTSSNTLEFYYSTGSGWQKNALNYDNTRVGGKTFAQSGRIEWGTTVGTCKPRYINGYYLYWYQFVLSAGSANISHITMDMPFQGLVDIWDGTYRSVIRYFVTGTTPYDATTKVLYEDYAGSDASTYSDLSSLPAFSDPANCLEIGFEERQTAMYFKIPTTTTNSTADTTMTVDYWNGSAYATVGTINDGTSSGAVSLALSGVVSWNSDGYSDESRKSVSNSPPLYYYRVKFDKQLDASTAIDYVGGITAAKVISHYKFPVFAQGRVLLCADMSGDKNKSIVSAKYLPQVYNGDDSVDLYCGDEGELNCGTELFSQYGSSLYSLILLFKDTETWVVAGQDITQWEQNTFLLSNSIGCPAPLTLKTINLRAEPGAGVNRALAIWQGSNGIYMSDGRAPIPIHGDIEEYFDPTDSRCIKYSMIGDSVSTIDHVNQSYIWKFASGSSATGINKELHYDIKRNKWYEVERPSALQNGLAVKDADGNFYTYGFLSDGHMYRLEYGNHFDGTPIKSTVHFGDMPLAGLGMESRISHIKLIEVAKTSALSSCVVTHYADGSTTGYEMSMSPARSGYRIAQPKQNEKLDADPFHSLKLEMTTNNEQIGFEPIAAVVTYHPTHQD